MKPRKIAKVDYSSVNIIDKINEIIDVINAEFDKPRKLSTEELPDLFKK
jgi:hypothetical protein